MLPTTALGRLHRRARLALAEACGVRGVTRRHPLWLNQMIQPVFSQHRPTRDCTCMGLYDRSRSVATTWPAHLHPGASGRIIKRWRTRSNPRAKTTRFGISRRRSAPGPWTRNGYGVAPTRSQTDTPNRMPPTSITPCVPFN
jgi:hypothetical protein